MKVTIPKIVHWAVQFIGVSLSARTATSITAPLKYPAITSARFGAPAVYPFAIPLLDGPSPGLKRGSRTEKVKSRHSGSANDNKIDGERRVRRGNWGSRVHSRFRARL